MASTLQRGDMAAIMAHARATFMAHIGPNATTTNIPLADLNLGSTNWAGNWVELQEGALGSGSARTVAQISSNTATAITLSSALSAAPSAGYAVWLYDTATINANIAENISQVGGQNVPSYDIARVPVIGYNEHIAGPYTTTALAASGSYTSSSIITNGHSRITGSVFADQAGTLNVQQSSDGTNWDVVSSFSVLASAGTGFSVELVCPYVRLNYVNGATAQTVFRLYSFFRRFA